MCACVYVCMYVRMYVGMCILCTYIYIYIHTYTHIICLRPHPCLSICVRVYIYINADVDGDANDDDAADDDDDDVLMLHALGLCTTSDSRALIGISQIRNSKPPLTNKPEGLDAWFGVQGLGCRVQGFGLRFWMGCGRWFTVWACRDRRQDDTSSAGLWTAGGAFGATPKPPKPQF